MQAQEVLSRLSGVVTSGAGWKALCPCHDDFRPSLSVTQGEGGRVLINCMAGCPTDAILVEIGLTFADIMGDGSPAARPGKKEVFDEEVNFRAGVYAALIDRLGLSRRHREELKRRGLGDGAIEAAQYRTLGFLGRRKALAALREEYGEDLYSVPGFADEAGRPRLVPSDGLLIPVRDLKGRVVGCQVRVGEPGRKYLWMSHREARSGSPCHVSANPYGFVIPWVTEGPLKADVASHLGEFWFLGVGGASQAMSAKGVIDQIPDVEKVILAFDMDWQTNAGVEEKVSDLGSALEREGYEVEMATWEGHKGIDDALLKGAKIRVGPCGLYV